MAYFWRRPIGLMICSGMAYQMNYYVNLMVDWRLRDNSNSLIGQVWIFGKRSMRIAEFQLLGSE